MYASTLLYPNLERGWVRKQFCNNIGGYEHEILNEVGGFAPLSYNYDVAASALVV